MVRFWQGGIKTFVCQRLPPVTSSFLPIFFERPRGNAMIMIECEMPVSLLKPERNSKVLSLDERYCRCAA